MIDFNGPDEKMLHRLPLSDAGRYMQAGQFGTGSMRPKVEAAARFVEHTGKSAVITSMAEIERGVAGSGGTQFV